MASHSSTPARRGAPDVPAAASLTHEHLLSVLVAEGLEPAGDTVRVLDIGCGPGVLTGYLQLALPGFWEGRRVEVYGFDVSGEGIQPHGFLGSATDALAERVPGIDWPERIRLIEPDAAWPFPDGFFDRAVSNQVGEHIPDLDRFFAECARVLRPGGIAVHLFPLKNYVLEGHLLAPWIHRIRDHRLVAAYYRGLMNLGVGKFRGARTQGPGVVAQVAEEHADYLHFFTAYHTWTQVADAAALARLRVSYRYTGELYARKLRALAGRGRPVGYHQARSAVGDAAWFHLCKYVSGVTVVLEKRQSYHVEQPLDTGAITSYSELS